MAPIDHNVASEWSPGQILVLAGSIMVSMIFFVVLGAAKASSNKKHSSKAKATGKKPSQASETSSSKDGCCACCWKKKKKEDEQKESIPTPKPAPATPSTSIYTNTTISGQESTPTFPSFVPFPNSQRSPQLQKEEERTIAENSEQFWDNRAKSARSLSLISWKDQVETSGGYRNVSDVRFPPANEPSLTLQSAPKVIESNTAETDSVTIASKDAMNATDLPSLKPSTIKPSLGQSISVIPDGNQSPSMSVVGQRPQQTPSGQSSSRSARVVKEPILADPLSRNDRREIRRKSIRQLEEHLSSPTAVLRKPRPVEAKEPVKQPSPPTTKKEKKRKRKRRRKKSSKDKKPSSDEMSFD